VVGSIFASGYGRNRKRRRKEELENNLLHNLKHFIGHDTERGCALCKHKNLVRNIARAIFRGCEIAVPAVEVGSFIGRCPARRAGELGCESLGMGDGRRASLWRGIL
jgi:hypothetical protein